MSSQCNVDSSKFSEPLPWIGLYIVGASFLCSLLMGLDTFLGFRRRKLWFPCRFFSLNATSLTLLSVATKLPVDLNTSMPRPQDQLTKLSGTVLICTVMGNFMTSLGTMDGSEMMSNIVALGILVVTVIVNVGIQMGTGVIYVFLPEHALIMLLMLVLLVMLCSTAVMIPTAKKLLQEKYSKIISDDEELKKFEEKQLKKFDEELKEYVNKHWMMAHTSSPQYVVGRSATCTASGALCLLGALILLQAAVRSFIIRSLAFCDGKSDYTWSMTLVFISQAIAIGVGTIAPATRWFKANRFRSPKGEFKVENYWVQKLVKWKESTIAFHISNRGRRRIFHFLKNGVLYVFIGMQRAVVKGSKLISLSILPVIWLSRLCCCRRSELPSKSNEGLKRHVLHLEGEEDLVQLIMTNGDEDTQHWICKGKNNRPSNLIKLLKSATISEGSPRVEEFDSNQVPCLGTKSRYRNCWALPIVNLTRIAIAIAPLCHEKDVKSLQRGVHDSLKYIRRIEEYLDAKRLINMRKAADIIWLGIDTNCCWLDKDLKKFGKSDDRTLVDEESSNDDTQRILEELAACGEKKVLAHTTGSEIEELAECGEKKVLAHTTGSEIEECPRDRSPEHTTGSENEEDPRDWPPEVLAANSMYRLCRTLQLKKLGTADKMFEWLQKTIAAIVGACLTNLPRVIFMTCACSRIETREESVRDAAYLLGETEGMVLELKIDRYPDKDEQYIDSWI